MLGWVCDAMSARGGSATASGSREPVGSVFIQLEVSRRIAVSLLVDGWSAEEKDRLLDGDRGAMQALKEEAERRTANSPDRIDVISSEVEFRGANEIPVAEPPLNQTKLAS